jgi:hypothetical protein
MGHPRGRGDKGVPRTEVDVPLEDGWYLYIRDLRPLSPEINHLEFSEWLNVSNAHF